MIGNRPISPSVPLAQPANRKKPLEILLESAKKMPHIVPLTGVSMAFTYPLRLLNNRSVANGVTISHTFKLVTQEAKDTSNPFAFYKGVQFQITQQLSQNMTKQFAFLVFDNHLMNTFPNQSLANHSMAGGLAGLLVDVPLGVALENRATRLQTGMARSPMSAFALAMLAFRDSSSSTAAFGLSRWMKETIPVLSEMKDGTVRHILCPTVTSVAVQLVATPAHNAYVYGLKHSGRSIPELWSGLTEKGVSGIWKGIGTRSIIFGVNNMILIGGFELWHSHASRHQGGK